MKNEAITSAKNTYKNFTSKFDANNYPFKEQIEAVLNGANPDDNLSPLSFQVELIPESVLDNLITSILDEIGCQFKKMTGINGISIIVNNYKEAGMSFVDVPGIASLLKGLIRSIESNLATMLKPYIYAIKLVQLSLKKGLKAIKFFIKQVKQTIQGIIQMLSDPAGVIYPIISTFITYIVNEAKFPLPNTDALISMILKPTEFDWCAFLKDVLKDPLQYLTIPSFFFEIDNMTESTISNTEKLKHLKIDPTTGISFLTQFLAYFNIQIPSYDGGECMTMIDFIKNLLLLPIKMLIDVLKSLFCTIKQMLTNLFKTISNITKMLSNPVQYFYGFLSEPLISLLSDLLHTFFPQVNIQLIKEMVEKIFGKIKTVLSLDIDAIKDMICEFINDAKNTYGAKVSYILDQMQYFVMMIISLITGTFKTIFNVPKIIAALFNKNVSEMTCEEAEEAINELKNEFKIYRPTKSYKVTIDDKGSRHGILYFYYDEDNNLSDQFEDEDGYYTVEFYHKKLSDTFGKEIILQGKISSIYEGDKDHDPYIVFENDPAYLYVSDLENVSITINGISYDKFIVTTTNTGKVSMLTTKEKVAGEISIAKTKLVNTGFSNEDINSFYDTRLTISLLDIDDAFFSDGYSLGDTYGRLYADDIDKIPDDDALKTHAATRA